MGQFFSKSKKNQITAQDKAILDLKIQRDKLKQYQKKLVVEKETELAKECLKKNDKRRALIALKKKKYQTQLMEKTDTQLINLEEMVSTIEFTLIEQKVLKGLEQGNSVLADIQKEMSIEDVERIMDDTADAIAYQNEISDLLGGKLSAEDEEDVLKELQMFEDEALLELPSVPVGKALQEAAIKEATTGKESEEIDQEEDKEPQLVAA